MTLRDGSRFQIRPIRPEDHRALQGMFRHLSPQSVYQRFFAALPELTDELAWKLSHVNYTNRMALVAETEGDSPEIVGVARYDRAEEPGVAELGLAIVDEWQGRGLGRILIRELMKVAERNGITRFIADVLADNRRMIHLLATEMKIASVKSSGGVTTFKLRLSRSTEGAGVF